MNTMSAPSRSRAIWSTFSWAAWRPIVGIGASSQALGEVGAELDLHGRRRGAQGLAVGVGDDEVDAGELRLQHAADGVAAAATEPDHLDLRPLRSASSSSNSGRRPRSFSISCLLVAGGSVGAPSRPPRSTRGLRWSETSARHNDGQRTSPNRAVSRRPRRLSGLFSTMSIEAAPARGRLAP